MRERSKRITKPMAKHNNKTMAKHNNKTMTKRKTKTMPKLTMVKRNIEEIDNRINKMISKSNVNTMVNPFQFWTSSSSKHTQGTHELYKALIHHDDRKAMGLIRRFEKEKVDFNYQHVCEINAVYTSLRLKKWHIFKALMMKKNSKGEYAVETHKVKTLTISYSMQEDFPKIISIIEKKK